MANIINFISSISEPTGLWYTILSWIDSWVFSAGWTIVLFTLFIKVIMSPLDFYNKYITRKNTFIQKRLAPQVEQINKTYASRKDVANQQVSALYKKEGYNMIGSCVFMIVNLALTLVVFFTFFASLRSMSEYKMLKQYETLHSTYYSTLDATSSESDAENAVLLKYNEIKDDFLWIKNIWRPDTSASVIPSYENLQKTIKASKNADYKAYLESVSENYNTVTKPISENFAGKWNGYFILAILAAVTSFLSQWISEKSNKSKYEKQILENSPISTQSETQKSTMKIMKFMLPIIMVVFVLTNTASFGIYIIVSSLISILISALINIFVNKLTEKEEEKYLEVLQKMKKNISKAKYQPVIKKPTIQPGVKL